MYASSAKRCWNLVGNCVVAGVAQFVIARKIVKRNIGKEVTGLCANRSEKIVFQGRIVLEILKFVLKFVF